MDLFYLGLVVAFFGLSVLLVLRHRKTGETVMTWLYILGAIVVTGLMVYLVVALLKPELFS